LLRFSLDFAGTGSMCGGNKGVDSDERAISTAIPLPSTSDMALHCANWRYVPLPASYVSTKTSLIRSL